MRIENHPILEFPQRETVPFVFDGKELEGLAGEPIAAALHAAACSPQPDAALRRVLGLLQAILRRTSYLALLDEQPSALTRLVNVLARSALLGERLRRAHLALLD